MSLIDKRSVFQIFGCLLQNPELLSDNRYIIERDDFPDDEPFYKIIFATIHNLHTQGNKDIDYIAIDSYLSTYDVQYKIFNDNNGIDYLQECKEKSSLENFEYNYNRFKKFSLIRSYKQSGVDIKDIYDESIIEPKSQEKMQEKFDGYTLKDIVDIIENKLLKIKNTFVSRTEGYGQQAGVGLYELKEKLKESPEMGIPLCSNILNTIVRGARLKKFYLRSAPTGAGKTRLAVGDACSYSIASIYDTLKKEWINTGFSEPTLFITTEIEIEEIQTLILAYVSGVNEDYILDGKYSGNDIDEELQVNRAIKVIESSPLWIEYLPDFNIEDVKNTIKKYKMEHDVKYVSFDYLHTSVKLLSEIASLSKGMRLREDQVLLMFSDKLKAMCNELNIHIDTSTQVNDDYKSVKDADQGVLRGAKAIGDKVDVGIVALEPTKSDLEAVQPILAKGFYKTPNMVYHIYKVRRGKVTRVKLWLYVDLGTCRTTDLFLTDREYKIIPIEATKIERVIEENSVKNSDVIIDESNNSKFTFKF